MFSRREAPDVRALARHGDELARKLVDLFKSIHGWKIDVSFSLGPVQGEEEKYRTWHFTLINRRNAPSQHVTSTAKEFLLRKVPSDAKIDLIQYIGEGTNE